MDHTIVHGRNIYYTDTGSGTPIVFLHPPGMGQAVFHRQRSLSENHRIITYDMCGHGRTERFREPVTIQTLSDELNDLLEALDLPKVVVVGYSAGGSVAQQFALTYPERMLGLVLSGGYPRVKTKALKFEYAAGLLLSKKAPGILARIIAKGHSTSKAEHEYLIEAMLQTDPQVWHDFYKSSYSFSCLDRIGSIACPLLIIYGQFARHIRAHSTDYERHVPNCSIAIIRHAFHELPTRNPEELNHLIDLFIQTKVCEEPANQLK